VELRNKNILLISPEPWSHIFVSKHHYAIHLGQRGNKVFFLNPPQSGQEVVETNFENVFSVTYDGFVSGLRFLPSVLQKKIIRKKFDSLQECCRVRFDIIWSFDNSVFFDFSALPNHVLKVSHIVDLNQSFQIERAARTADYCFCTTDFIKEKLLRFNPSVFKLSHGYNLQTTTRALPLPGKSTIKTFYAGNLAIPYIDWASIDKLVETNRGVDFVFAGSNKTVLPNDVIQSNSKQSVLNSSNCFFIGPVESNELNNYMVSSDILLVAYQADQYFEQVANPHKMMEYLGSGKMIVSTFTAEYEQLAKDKLLVMSKSNNEFSLLFDEVLKNLEWWNSKDKQQLRSAVALENTYLKLIEKFEKWIDTNQIQ